ncbi:hypothetical protein [Luteipulveratus mongoliensis]|uniref:Uncharacterized protein n=1 Tax=Luteipulveratus mongoliensis TaxID=571913 RepID=A0A0K1JKR0_9MICO|nr:hypothetical protein [Luteipulveratus mongoliensis]AKU17291.1 hypothetical protein VV02_17930 [Luteipulveratus mongoliensis]
MVPTEAEFVAYVARKQERGEVPRDFDGYSEALERWAHARQVGDAWVVEIHAGLDCRLDRGYSQEAYYSTKLGRRFHDVGVELEHPLAIEAKAGGTNAEHALLQLRKDRELLERDGTMLWLVRDMGKMPPAVRGRMDELREIYPDTFIVREITDANAGEVFEELRELLRSKELEHWSERERTLADDLALAEEDPAAAQTQRAALSEELALVRAQRAEIQHDLVAVVDQRAERAARSRPIGLAARIAEQRATQLPGQYAQGLSYVARVARGTRSRDAGLER